MSFFDPQHLYYRSQRYSHKGQVLHKKPVKQDYALTSEDLKDAIKIVQAYGYYISPSPPTNLQLYSELYTVNVNPTPNYYTYSFKWSSLYAGINNTSILQDAPPGSQFSLKIRLISISCVTDMITPLTGSTISLTFDNLETSINTTYNCFFELTPQTSAEYQLVYGADQNTFSPSNNIRSIQLENPESSSSLSSYTIEDIDQFRTDHLPDTNAFSITMSHVDEELDFINATFIISINAAY